MFSVSFLLVCVPESTKGFWSSWWHWLRYTTWREGIDNYPPGINRQPSRRQLTCILRDFANAYLPHRNIKYIAFYRDQRGCIPLSGVPLLVPAQTILPLPSCWTEFVTMPTTFILIACFPTEAGVLVLSHWVGTRDPWLPISAKIEVTLER